MTTVSTPAIDRVLGLLEERGLVVKKGREWLCHCPAHDDSNPSLNVAEGDDGRVLIKCRSRGCSTRSIVAALGLTQRDLFENGDASQTNLNDRILRTYDYLDEEGKLLYQAVRLRAPPPKNKDFRQRRPDGRGGWIWDLKKIRRLLYRLPELLKADPAKIVFLVEGEKDVETLVKLGLVATTNPMGAGKWRQEYADSLKGRIVVILADNDDPGRKHANQLADSLKGIAASVKIVELPGLPEKGDVSDWVEERVAGSAEVVDYPAIARELMALVEQPAKVINPIAEDAGPPVMLSDAGNAYQFRLHHGDRVRHVDVWNSFLVWDGSRWGHDRCLEVEHLAKQTVNRLYLESSAESQRTGSGGNDQDVMAIRRAAETKMAHARRSHSAKAIRDMLALARSEPGIRLLPEVFDTDHWALNTPAGTIDLRTGEIRPHRREDCITKLCPTPYDPSAACPTWERFLDLVFDGDADLIEFLQRLFGYALTGETCEHVLTVFWGDGSNGKSTFLEVVMEVMGSDYAMKAPQNMLMARDHEAHPTERADLHGKRLVCAVETEDGKRLAESLIKELTGGDTIRARRMRQDFLEFAPTHKLILCTNHKPQVRGSDNGTWRRLRLVPFTARFWNPDEPATLGEVRPDHLRADKTMKDRLVAERQGILAWMVRGCLKWQADGLGLPQRVAEATSQYRAEENILGRFINDRCEQDKQFQVRSERLYTAFKEWCQFAGIEDTPTQRSFGLMMTQAGYERKVSAGTWYVGLQLPNAEYEQ